MTFSADFRRALPPGATVSRWGAPDGWSHRRFDWPSDGTRSDGTGGRILFQGGRGDVFEKYLESFARWHALGWSITSFDWRGQGGSGRLSPDPRIGHADDFGVFIADLAAFWRVWSAEGAGARALFGHSMGGHLVLRAIVEGAVDPDAAVLVAPMLGLKSPLGAGIGGRLASWMAGRGDPMRAAWKSNERPGSITSRQKLLTHDRSRYDDELWWYAENPDIRLGPPSWAWLAEAFRSTAALEADSRLETLAVPVLMLVADADGLVDARAAVRIAARLPNGQIVRFGRESAHEILREADVVRDRALAAIDSFLDPVCGQLETSKPLPFRGGVGVGPAHKRFARGTAPPPSPPLKGRGELG